MQRMTTDELRKAYLDFFRAKGHAVIAGAPLVPENDPTVLFTTAGMHPLVPYLMGETHPAGKRLVDVQRCVRTGDIDEVGDSSHLTMFEMLGNWSLGDYFKEGAIAMSFEFLTKVLEIPIEKLAVTCFEGDNDAPRDTESAEFWKNVGIPAERIGFLPKAKNWWGPAGQTGPCGPDTEMFYWVGDPTSSASGGLRGARPQGNPASHPNCWLEIWNDVFMQYEKLADGSYVPLKQKNVDTGMGLERVAAVLQGVESVYETDRMKAIMEAVVRQAHHDIHAAPHPNPLPSAFAKAAADKLGEGKNRHERIIVDHLKAATFIIADGVSPSNVDRGYVLRRLIRRAIRSARQLGIAYDGDFTPAIAVEVIAQYGHVYEQLKSKKQTITETLRHEEQQFGKTLQEGLKQFEKISGAIDGMTAFHLYDTYGFPLELTRELAREHGRTVDEQGFQKAFEKHQKLSRAGAQQRFKGGLADHSAETTKLHTATHLLNAALRKVLGPHVQQKGSNITAERLRFDFNHTDKMTPEQIKEVERLVNEAIEADLPVSYHVTTVEGAKQEGAIGVFDDRYGAQVKVYTIGPRHGEPAEPFSKEICGGPHVAHTGMIGSFKIQKEESCAAGIRRIKAIVKGGLLSFLLFIAIPSVHAMQEDVWDLKSQGDRMQSQNLTHVTVTAEGVHVQTDTDGYLFWDSPLEHPIDVLELTSKNTKGVKAALLWYADNKNIDTSQSQLDIDLPPSAAFHTVSVIPTDFRAWNWKSAQVGIGFSKGSDVVVQRVTWKRWSTSEKVAEGWKTFWTFDLMRAYSINFLWGPLLTFNPVARSMLFDHQPPYAWSADRLFYLMIAVAGVVALMRRTRGAAIFFGCTCVALWMLFDLRMGAEILSYARNDYLSYISQPVEQKILRTHEHLYGDMERALPIIRRYDRFVVLPMQGSPTYANLRYVSYPTVALRPEDDHTGVKLWFVSRPGIHVDTDRRLIDEHGAVLTEPGSIQLFIDANTFLFATP